MNEESLSRLYDDEENTIHETAWKTRRQANKKMTDLISVFMELTVKWAYLYYSNNYKSN